MREREREGGEGGEAWRVCEPTAYCAGDAAS